MKWEYLHIVEDSFGRIQKRLDQAGLLGWELIAVIARESNGCGPIDLFFKRQKEEPI
jgi:hypothetical protein